MENAQRLPGVAKPIAGLDVRALRDAINDEYAAVATNPEQGFHFHTGRRLTALLGYDDAWLEGIPEATIASFAGTGNPFRLGRLPLGAHIVDVGCGAGIDSFIASNMVGDAGRVVGIDMTIAMLDKARRSAEESAAANVEFREGLAEALPVDEEWADVVISNGAMNLCPHKLAALSEMARVLKPGGRLQIADILVQKPVGDGAKRNIALWKG
jgi:arsenite methyltransferase